MDNRLQFLEANVRITHQALIAESKAGNPNAQYQLYSLYVDAMFNTAYRLLSSREDAEDILQESFVEAFRKLDSFRFESTFGAWLKRIVVNRSINYLRTKRMVFVSTEVSEEAIPEESNDVNQPLQVEKVKKGIAQLPEGYRQIITLYLIEGYDHVEIGEILNISTSTSKSQYHRAKRKLIGIINEM